MPLKSGLEVVIGYDFKHPVTKIKSTGIEWQSLVHDRVLAGAWIGPNWPYWESLSALKFFIAGLPATIRETGVVVAVTEWTSRRDGKTTRFPTNDGLVLPNPRWQLIGYEVGDDGFSKIYPLASDYVAQRREDGLFDDVTTARYFVCECHRYEPSRDKNWIYGLYLER